MERFVTEYMTKSPEAELVSITINAIAMLLSNLESFELTCTYTK
jgi:hypothetical protein